MKKTVVLVLALSALVSLSLSAQGFYLDAGFGFGKAKTKVNGVDFVGELKRESGFAPDEIGVDLDLKAGYGPFGRIPLFFIGEFGGIGHRISDSYDYIQFSSYLAGGGAVFYPLDFAQIGASAGYSFISNSTDIPGLVFYEGDGGFAWNVSAAFDLGERNHGCLLGLKYFNAINKVKVSGVKENASLFSVFVKYAFRNKKPRNA